MAPMGNVISSIIIFLLFLCSLRHNAVRGEHQLNLERISAKQTICSESKVLDERSVKIVHAYGPCSPTGQQPPTFAEMVARDSLRQAHLHRRVQPQAVGADNHSRGGAAGLGQSKTRVRVSVTAIAPTGYMVPIFVGTPKRLMHVFLDTGSDLCWIQCEPCIYCYRQRDPIFNPASSYSFRYEPCTDPTCNHTTRFRSDARGCYQGRCTYEVNYTDGSYSSGFLARDKVTLVGTASLQNFFFGCGDDNQAIFTEAAGIVGLGQTERSLNKQMSHMGNIFSYCLPPTIRDSGYLTIGDGTYPPAEYTPIVPDSNYPSFYFIRLLAMSVNSRLLPVPEGLFVGAKTFIDSGTTITSIPWLAYNALKEVIRNIMHQYRLVPPLYRDMDTCYDFRNVTVVDSPIVTLHFNGANLSIGFDQMFINHHLYEHIYCLAFKANSLTRGPSVFGATLQRGLEVIYDLGQNRIGFSTTITNCR